MTHRDFVYWLQGFLEVSGSKELDSIQLACVRRHIELVLKNVTDEGTRAGIHPLLGGLGDRVSFC